MMGNSVQQRGCHFRIPKDRDPLPELQIGRNDDACLLVEFTDEMEQKCSTGLWEWNIAKFAYSATFGT